MATEESYIHKDIKQQMLEADENQTTHIFRTLRNTARVFKNKVRALSLSLGRLGQTSTFGHPLMLRLLRTRSLWKSERRRTDPEESNSRRSHL